MNPSPENRSVRETTMLRPKLRDGLHFAIQEHGGRRVCVIEDPHSSKFHRAGLTEYRFLRALDGRQTVASILARMARDGGSEAFTEAEALQILHWLNENHLLEVEGSRSGGGESARKARELQQAVTWLNPLILKVPLAEPDRVFTKILPYLRPALGGAGALVWLVVVAIGAAQIGLGWSRFHSSFDGILGRDNWLWLALAWTFLKVVHELGHGLFCKRFGYGVREVGVIFVVFFPIGYVDATASLGLASKWRRIMVSCAGLYVEFFIAALAAIVWAQTGPGIANTIAHNIVVTGTVVTLFFNANPLMRFDGYYILSDLLEIPNLATRGRQFVTGLAGWLLMGAASMRPSLPRTREEIIVAFYGVAALLWQTMVLAGLILMAGGMWHGGGLVLALAGAALWIGLPLHRFLHSILERSQSDSRLLGRLALRLSLAMLALGVILFVPYHKRVSSPGVIEYADARTIRAECPGFVEHVLVKNGDVVEAGQVLVELRNDQERTGLSQSRISLDQLDLRSRIAYTRADVAAFQAEQTKADAERKTVALKERFVATLEVRAPIAGRVVNPRLDELQGAYLRTGDEILELGRADQREVRLAISQENEPHFRGGIGAPLRVRISGRGGSLPARLDQVDANASRDIIHPALTALAGGELALRRATDGQDDRTDARQQSYELAEPHFRGTALLASDPAGNLRAGETVRARFRSTRTVSLWTELQRRLARWAAAYATRRSAD